MIRIEGIPELNEGFIALIPKQVHGKIFKNITVRPATEDKITYLLVELENPEDEEAVFDVLFDLGYTVELVAST